MNKPIIVDESIYRNPFTVIKGFHLIGYKININHPEITKLYDAYRIKIKYPRCMPMSDEQRYEFEDIIFRAIENGKIIVKTTEKNQPEVSNGSD